MHRNVLLIFNEQNAIWSDTGIGILWNFDFGTAFRIRNLFRKLHLQILQNPIEGRKER